MMAMSNDEFMTVAEVASVLKLNQQTVRNWIEAGALPALRVGRRVRVRRQDFDQLVERGYRKRPKGSGGSVQSRPVLVRRPSRSPRSPGSPA